MRSDFQSATEELSRLDVLCGVFDRNNREDWPHLKNQEDFSRVYGLDWEFQKPFKRLYERGRDFAVYMTGLLSSYGFADDYPTFSDFVRSLEEWLTANMPEFEAVLDNAAAARMKLSRTPWAVDEMIELHGKQLKMAKSLADWIRMAKATSLYRKENQLMSDENPSINSGRINIQNFQGILGNVIHSTVEQNLAFNVVQGDFESLRNELQKIGLDSSEIDQLEKAVRKDPRPATRERFGPAVSAWLGKTLQRAAEGAYELTMATAGGVLAELLMKYYGLM
jgi:hypothetical protein